MMGSHPKLLERDLMWSDKCFDEMASGELGAKVGADRPAGRHEQGRQWPKKGSERGVLRQGGGKADSSYWGAGSWGTQKTC